MPNLEYPNKTFQILIIVIFQKHPQQPDQNALEIGSLSVHNLNLIWATCDMPHYCCSVYAHVLAYTLGLPPQLTCETRRRSYNRQSGSHISDFHVIHCDVNYMFGFS